MQEREENLQEKLKRNELSVLLFDKEAENASLPELVKHHNTKQCSPKCQEQHQTIWLPWPRSAAIVHSFVSHLSLRVSEAKEKTKERKKERNGLSFVLLLKGLNEKLLLLGGCLSCKKSHATTHCLAPGAGLEWR